jgi:putative ABC transport system ATP-binding protein
MGRPLIELAGVEKDYVSGPVVVRALVGLDLAIASGEFVAIIGTSGSGKSTLMNIIGCLDRPTRGTYRLEGIDVGRRSNDARAIVRNRLIGFIFQGFNLLARTTAVENVELPLVYRGVPVKERRARALAALEQVGLGHRVDHTPNQLSGGQQQRVAIARALVTDPPLLLADEPTGNLDSRTSDEVLALLQRLNRERGITIVLVTHEHEIAACASRVVTFRDGRLRSDVRSASPRDAALSLAPAAAGAA